MKLTKKKEGNLLEFIAFQEIRIVDGIMGDDFLKLHLEKLNGIEVISYIPFIQSQTNYSILYFNNSNKNTKKLLNQTFLVFL